MIHGASRRLLIMGVIVVYLPIFQPAGMVK
jgi:hypothetical protein